MLLKANEYKATIRNEIGFAREFEAAHRGEKVARTVRFWVRMGQGYGYGWVRLTLEPGQFIQQWTYYPTEEGWGEDTICYHNMGDRIEFRHAHEGEDCDGRISRNYFADALLEDLEAVVIGEDGGLKVPAWRNQREQYRDYQAEAAGY